MRDFTKSHKLQADSLVEIKRGLIRATEAINDAGARYRGRPVKPAHVLQGLAVLFLRLPPAEQRTMGIDGLNALLGVQDSGVPVALIPREPESGTTTGGKRLTGPRGDSA